MGNEKPFSFSLVESKKSIVVGLIINLIFFYFHTFYLTFGLNLAMLRVYSWIITKELLLVDFGNHIRCWELNLYQPLARKVL